MYKPILNYFRKEIHLKPEEEDHLIQALRYKKYRKGQHILQEGEICYSETYIIKGLVRLYFVDLSGRQYTLMFAEENCWISDFESNINQIPSKLNIQAMENCEIFQLHHEKKKVLYKYIPKIESHFNKMTQQNLALTIQKIIDYLSLSSIDRYLDFLSKHNGIYLRIPQRHIASYIGITPQFLSQIRAELTTKMTVNMTYLKRSKWA